MASSHHVSVAAFSGPFDLLLHLIARRKLDVHDVPLAQITDDYLAVMRQMERLDLEVATDFLLVAATLLELKVARLLPGDEDPELDELALEARDLLYARLLDYRTFKQAAGALAAGLEAGEGYVPRAVALESRFAALRPHVDLRLTPDDLAALAACALAEQPAPVVDTSHVQPRRMTVREAADLVGGELARAGGRATFARLTGACRHRSEVVVCFLALLELYKLGQVDLHQAERFGDLIVSAGADPDVTLLADVGAAS